MGISVEANIVTPKILYGHRRFSFED